jgi:excinuclease ABC subunit A
VLTMLEKQFVTETQEERLGVLASYRGWCNARTAADPGSGRKPISSASGARRSTKSAACRCATRKHFSQNLPVPTNLQPVATPLVVEIRKRLEFLIKVGADYLTLERAADTLSGGELQRVRLATSIGSALVGVCYVLDEPSIGLHPRDNQR